jgi:hypothetical protein
MHPIVKQTIANLPTKQKQTATKIYYSVNIEDVVRMSRDLRFGKRIECNNMSSLAFRILAVRVFTIVSRFTRIKPYATNRHLSSFIFNNGASLTHKT